MASAQLVTAKDAPDFIRNDFPDAVWFIIIDGKPSDFAVPVGEIRDHMKGMGVEFTLSDRWYDAKRVFVGREVEPLLGALNIPAKFP